MKSRWNFVFLIAAVLLSAAYLAGVDRVPFHPDESTQIFMSADFETWLRDPFSLAWQPQPTDTLRQTYRLLDAPLARNLIAIGRILNRNQPALTADWDWSADWQENQRAGALPNEALLLTARCAIAALFPLSLLLIFACGLRLGGQPTAWIASLLFAGNALVLLHTRRAMSEGALVFTVILTLFALLFFEKKPWLLAIAAALAFSAKQSAGVLMFAGIAVILLPAQPLAFKLRLKNLSGYLLLFAALVLLLYPVLWSNPLNASIAAWNARQQLLAQQIGMIASLNPELMLTGFSERLATFVIHFFMSPPAIADVANYLNQTSATQQAYLANPLHALGRGVAGGAILLAFTLVGAAIGVNKIYRRAPERRQMIVLIFATALQILALVAVVSLPFQRYVIPAVPFVCLWAAIGITSIRNTNHTARSN